MATFRKQPSGKWRAEVVVDGARKSKVCNTKIEAKQWAFEKEIELSASSSIVPGKTLADALHRYVEEVSTTKRGERWERVRANALARMDIGKMQLENINQQTISRWIAERANSVQNSTINRELNFISAVIEHAKDHWAWIADNPVRQIKRPKNPESRDRRISEHEIERILLALDDYKPMHAPLTLRHEIAICFLFALETAMRQGEIWGMEWKHVHTNERYVHLPLTKNGTARNVPLSSAAAGLLECMATKGQLGRVFKSNQESAGAIFRSSLKLAGIDGLTFHDTRHEALTRLARKLDVLDLARMVGHRDPRSLMIYYNATATEIAGRLG